MQILLHSRKFWIMIVDVVVSSILYFVGKYWVPGIEDVKFLIATLQPVILLVIASIATEDVAAMYNGIQRK